MKQECAGGSPAGGRPQGLWASRPDDWLDHLFAEGFPARRVKYGRTVMGPSRGRYFTRQDAENGIRVFALPKPISFWDGRLERIIADG
ncbi:MAG: hypothetical protein ACREFE_11335 [Limisphaerales bacterium]